MKRLISYFIVSIMALMLTACGFHLRGTNDDKIEIKEMAVSAGDKYGPFVKELKERLTAAGVKIYDTAEYKLTVSEKWDDRTLSFANDIRGTEIAKILTLEYQIYGTGGLLLIDDSLEARGEYISDSNNIVADELQSDQIDKRIRADAVNLLLERLQAVSAEQLDTLQKAAEEQVRLKAEAEKAQQKALEERRKSLLNSIPLDEIEKFNER